LVIELLNHEVFYLVVNYFQELLEKVT